MPLVLSTTLRLRVPWAQVVTAEGKTPFLDSRIRSRPDATYRIFLRFDDLWTLRCLLFVVLRCSEVSRASWLARSKTGKGIVLQPSAGPCPWPGVEDMEEANMYPQSYPGFQAASGFTHGLSVSARESGLTSGRRDEPVVLPLKFRNPR